MTLCTQVLTTFDTIRKFPGLDVEGLAEKLRELHGENTVIKFMTHGDSKYPTIKMVLKELNCVEEKDGRYYFNPKIRPYSESQILNLFITNYLEKVLNEQA